MTSLRIRDPHRSWLDGLKAIIERAKEQIKTKYKKKKDNLRKHLDYAHSALVRHCLTMNIFAFSCAIRNAFRLYNIKKYIYMINWELKVS